MCGEGVDHSFVDGVGREGSVDEGVGGGVLLGHAEVGLADALVELAALGLHAVEEGAEARGGDVWRDVEDEDEVGGEAGDGDVGEGLDLRDGHAAGRALVGDGGADEAVGEDGSALEEGGPDDAFDELGAAGHVEEGFAADGDVFVVVIEEEGADELADACAAGLADVAGVEALGVEGVFAEGLEEACELGGFAGAVGAFKDDETALEALDERGREHG